MYRAMWCPQVDKCPLRSAVVHITIHHCIQIALLGVFMHEAPLKIQKFHGTEWPLSHTTGAWKSQCNNGMTNRHHHLWRETGQGKAKDKWREGPVQTNLHFLWSQFSLKRCFFLDTGTVCRNVAFFPPEWEGDCWEDSLHHFRSQYGAVADNSTSKMSLHGQVSHPSSTAKC